MELPASSRFSRFLTLRTRRHDVVRASSRRVRTLRYDPQLDSKIRTASTINHYDTRSIDSAVVDQVILGALCTSSTFTLTATVDNVVALSSWLVLQLNREVVESGLLIVESDVAILVELNCDWLRWSYRGRARCRSGTGRIDTTYFNRCSYCLTSKARRVDCNRGRSLAARDCACRH